MEKKIITIKEQVLIDNFDKYFSLLERNELDEIHVDRGEGNEWVVMIPYSTYRFISGED